MYIEDRLFSENEQEIYYSLILNESEMRLYSEFQREFAIKSSPEMQTKAGEAISKATRYAKYLIKKAQHISNNSKYHEIEREEGFGKILKGLGIKNPDGKEKIKELTKQWQEAIGYNQ